MATVNHSLLPAKPEFSCTAFISSSAFELDGSPAIQITKCVLAVFMSLTTTLGNLLVIISIRRTPSLHSPSITFLVSLAVTDFGVGALVLPLMIPPNVAKAIQEASLYCKTRQATWVCGVPLCTVSLLTLTAIQTDRYLAIHYHLRYREIVTVKRVRVTIISIWILGSATTVLYIAERPELLTPTLTVFTVLSFLIIIVTSYLIRRVVRRHERNIASQMQVRVHDGGGSRLKLQRFKRSFKNTQILFWALLVCYLPYVVIRWIISATGLTPSKESARELCSLLVCFNSLLDPFIYCWRYGPIRASVIKLLRDLLGKNPPSNHQITQPRA